jgi:hypothetical protein
MGGIAVRAYAVPRPTYDIDLTITIDRKHLPQLFKQLKKFDYSIPELYETGWVDEVKGLKLLKLRRYLREESLDVDLFLAETDFQSEVMNRRGEVEAEGKTIWLVSPEDLVLMKLLAARPRDLVDVSDILFMQGQLDLRYMRGWAGQLGISAELESKLAEQSVD